LKRDGGGATIGNGGEKSEKEAVRGAKGGFENAVGEDLRKQKR